MDYSALPRRIRNRVQSNNDSALDALIKQLRSPLGVIPFLGAGISAPLKYRQWGEFLGGIAREQLGATERKAVEELLRKEDFLRAAGLVEKALGQRDFQQAIAEEFSDDRLRDADLSGGTFAYLPLIASGPVITTNFDRVIENVFKRAERAFEDQVFGANRDGVIPAIQQNLPVLWKIHGDRSDSRTRTFTKKEYDRHYRELPDLLLLAFLNRPALFIGSSLEQDRTTQVLTSVSSQHQGSSHFAFQQIPGTEEKFDGRVQTLRDMGVRPIWYRQGQYEEIAGHLSDVVHGASSLALPAARIEIPADVPQLTPEQASRAQTRELKELSKRLRSATPGAGRRRAEAPRYAPILDKITRGQMAFFLGSGACLGRLPLGEEFYKRLLRAFSGESGGRAAAGQYGNMEPERLAQHFADKYGRDALYSQVNEQLARTAPAPTAVHWFVATVRSRLLARGGQPREQWILTTNYDEWMEHTLRLTGQRFHLFTFRVGQPYAGHFVYQSPEGAVHVIDRPSHFRRLPDDGLTVLVKLHGGQHRYLNLPIAYVFTHRDFVELAGRAPTAIPRVIFDRLAERSLLFLGSGLGDDSIESIVRGMRAADPNKLSWAVQWPIRPEKSIYWQQIGVSMVGIRLEKFMLELNRELG